MGLVKVHVVNRYGDTVYAKVARDTQTVESGSFAFDIGAGPAKLGASASAKYDLGQIENKFSRIAKEGSQQYEIKVPFFSFFSAQVYLTVFSRTGKPLCNTLPIGKSSNFIVAPSGNVVRASRDNPYEYKDQRDAGVRGNEGEKPLPETNIPSVLD